jgi:hypothetical protein
LSRHLGLIDANAQRFALSTPILRGSCSLIIDERQFVCSGRLVSRPRTVETLPLS